MRENDAKAWCFFNLVENRAETFIVFLGFVGISSHILVIILIENINKEIVVAHELFW